MRKLILLLLACGLSFSVAAEAPRGAADPVLEAKVKSLSEVLLCVVCQSQTLADSDTDLAIDLKSRVHELLSQGRTEKQVIDYMVERYGDFVRYSPPLKNTTGLLWWAPFLLLFGGALGLIWLLKRRDGVSEKPLGAADRQAAVRLLRG